MKRYTVLALVLVALVAVTGGVYAFVSQQPNDVVRLQPGQTWQVSLDSNPSTGYSWRAEYDESLVELVDSEFAGGSSGMVGAAGKETLTFRALGTGTTKVTLKYQRPWEGQPEQTLTYTLKITQ